MTSTGEKRTIVKRTFEAAHRLPNVPASHKCFRIHGHSYQVQLTADGEERQLSASVDEIVGSLDHRYLNEIEGLTNPAAEQIAIWLWDKLAHRFSLREVRVGENEDSACVYRGDCHVT